MAQYDRAAIPQCEFEQELAGVRADDLQAQLLLLNQRQRSSRSVPAAALPALDHRIDAIGLRAPRRFEDSPDMNATDFGNVSPRVTLFAKHKRLPTDVFEGFGRELSGVDFSCQNYINIYLIAGLMAYQACHTKDFVHCCIGSLERQLNFVYLSLGQSAVQGPLWVATTSSMNRRPAVRRRWA